MAIILGRKGGSGGGGGAPSGPAGGVLAGTYPNPTFAADPPGTLIATAQITAPVSVTATVEGTPTDVVSSGAVAYDGTEVKIEFFASNIEAGATAGSYVLLNLWDGSTDLGRVLSVGHSALTFLPRTGAYIVQYVTPTAASHTYRIRAWRSTSDGTISAGAGGAGTAVPAFIRVTKA